MKRLQRLQIYVYGLLFSLLALMQPAQAAGECSTTGGICEKFVGKIGAFFTEISDLSLWLVLMFLAVTFIFFAFYKINGASKRT